ncbi:LysR family substrate-binding domain-containing protein [Streptomyces violascens]|uniref:LysR family substrate-binding domain-containing protein n=1 Tax=Streptomyces violascens TaxID=67381 RepID=UPI0036601E79
MTVRSTQRRAAPAISAARARPERPCASRTSAAGTRRTRRVASGHEGELRLGFISSLSYDFLPRLLRRTHAELPGLRLHLSQRPSAELVDMLHAGTLDLALVRLPTLGAERLTVRRIAVERLVVALPEHHALTAERSLDLRELAGQKFALPKSSALPGLAQQVTLACAQAASSRNHWARRTTCRGCSAMSPPACVWRSPPSRYSRWGFPV